MRNRFTKFFLISFFAFIPYFGFSQICFTNFSVSNADSIQYCINQSSCHSSCDGEISIVVYGDNQPYFFEWGSEGIIEANDYFRDSLCAGNYSVTITDNNNNFVDFSSNVVDEPSEIGLVKNQTSPSCNGLSDGEINLTTFGDSPFIWNWSNGFNTESIDSLTQGEYIVQIIDANDCLRIDTFFISEPPKVSSQTFSDTVSCYNVCDGLGIVTPLIGNAPFSFLWQNSSTNDTVNNLCQGLNYVTITDLNGCENLDSVFVEKPDSFYFSNFVSDSACFKSCDGSISFELENGVQPFNIELIFEGSIIDSTSNSSFSQLCEGLYSLNVTDLNDCQINNDIYVFEKDSFIVSSLIINDSCYNSCSGQIEVDVLNANESNLNFVWSNGVLDSPINSGLCADTFNLEIIDSDLCRDTFVYIINQPEKLSVDSVSIFDNDCFSESKGAILIDFSGGTGIIETNWSNLSGYYSSNEDISDLESGAYILQLSDEFNCNVDTTFLVDQPDSLISSISKIDVSCFSYSDGKIEVDIFGGVLPYNISWNNSLSDSSSIDNLSSGEYIFTIIDSNDCMISDTVILSEPQELQLEESITNVLCKGQETGVIDITVSGGTPQYQYQWSNSSTNEDLLNAPAGNYTLNITDQNNCILIKNYNINEPLLPLSVAANITPILCFDENTGEIDISVFGGVGPYDLQWSNGGVSTTIIDLVSDTYSITIIDDNDCSLDTSFYVNQNDEISVNATISDVLCFGDSSGSISITSITGGESPYNYQLSNGANLSPFILSEGFYSLDVYDNNNCSKSFQYLINQPDLLSYNINPSDINCHGFGDGSISLDINGGTQPYNILWDNNSTSQNLSNLDEGTYSVLVTDFNGCTVSASALINEPDDILVSYTIEDLVCANSSSGSIVTQASGGTGSLNYLWSNGEINQNLININAGNYTLSVSDDLNCTEILQFEVLQPDEYFINHNITNVSCFGGNDGQIELDIVGNTPPYSFLWNTGATNSNIENLFSGIYTLTVTDSNNCIETFDVEVIQPDEINLDFIVMDASCFENNDGEITTIVSGGSLPYQFLWSNGEVTKDLFNLSEGNYNLLITDANNCQLSSEIIDVNFDGFDGCIEIPSAFTPNSDGIHDEWAIYGLFNFPDVKVNVFNRWGQLVFNSTGYDIPWDGKYNGVDLPTSTYYYILEIEEINKVFNGTVTIKK